MEAKWYRILDKKLTQFWYTSWLPGPTTLSGILQHPIVCFIILLNLSPSVKLHDVVKTSWLQDCLVSPSLSFYIHFYNCLFSIKIIRMLAIVFHCCRTICGSPQKKPNNILHNFMTEMVIATLKTVLKSL